MANWRSIGDFLHRTTHLVPGLPEHGEHGTGHHGRKGAGPRLNGRPVNQGDPQVLVAWQRRIATFAGRK
jgi:hypothetical protein